MTKKIFVVSGPYLNGDPPNYEIQKAFVQGRAASLGFEIEFAKRTDHHEYIASLILEKYKDNACDGMIIDAGDFIHTSREIREATRMLTACKMPFVQVHYGSPTEMLDLLSESGMVPKVKIDAFMAGRTLALYIDAFYCLTRQMQKAAR